MLLERHPDNTLFLITYAGWKFRQNSIDSAMIAAQKAVEINTRNKIRYGDEFAYSTLSSCSYSKNNFEKAKEYVELYIEKSENKENISNWTYYRLGVCYEMTGNRELAIASFKRMKRVQNKDRASDTYYFRKGQEQIIKPMDEIDRRLLRAGNDATMKDFAAAASAYKEIAQTPELDVDRRAIAVYNLADALYEAEEYTQIPAVAQQLFALKPSAETWLIPYGHFRLGQTYAKLGKITDARREFELIDDFDKYDFQNSLENRVEKELKKLNAAAPASAKIHIPK